MKKVQILLITIFIVVIVLGLAVYILTAGKNYQQHNDAIQNLTATPQISSTHNQTFASTSPSFPITTLTPLVDTAGWRTFTDPNYGYFFRYPVNWQMQEFPKKGDAALPIGAGENFYYGSHFFIPNTISPQDSPFQVQVSLYDNTSNLPLVQWVKLHPSSYASIQPEHIDKQIVIKKYNAIKTTITPDVRVWGSLPPFDEAYFINPTIRNKSIVLAISIVGDGQGSTKLYTNEDPFVKKELPIFDTFVSSFTFPK